MRGLINARPVRPARGRSFARKILKRARDRRADGGPPTATKSIPSVPTTAGARGGFSLHRTLRRRRPRRRRRERRRRLRARVSRATSPPPPPREASPPWPPGFRISSRAEEHASLFHGRAGERGPKRRRARPEDAGDATVFFLLLLLLLLLGVDVYLVTPSCHLEVVGKGAFSVLGARGGVAEGVPRDLEAADVDEELGVHGDSGDGRGDAPGANESTGWPTRTARRSSRRAAPPGTRWRVGWRGGRVARRWSRTRCAQRVLPRRWSEPVSAWWERRSARRSRALPRNLPRRRYLRATAVEASRPRSFAPVTLRGCARSRDPAPIIAA